MKKRTPIKAKIHSANKAMSVADMKALEAKENENQRKLNIEKKQQEIDYYNFTLINEIDPYFKGISLTDESIIVRLHKENYIKEISIMPNGDVVYDAWTSQVDGRTSKTQKQKWVDNPLPYVFSGVIVAISPLTQAKFIEKRDSLPEELRDEFKIPQVGDTIMLDHFMIQDRRFYQNKQARDFIRNPEEYRIIHFEGYVKIHPSLIESVVVDMQDFNNNMSPYTNYLKYIQQHNIEVNKEDETLEVELKTEDNE
jgi:hypothetical protein